MIARSNRRESEFDRRSRVSGTLRRTVRRRYARPAPDLQLELEREVEAPAIARAAVTGICEDAAVEQSPCFTIVLLVSELVTNALLHSEAQRETPIVLTLTLSEDAVRVTVTDKGHGFTPKPRDPSSREGGGYGLYLLEKSATRWGVNSLGGTCVWFELNL